MSPQAHRSVDADLFNELGTAEITIRMANLGNNIYAHAEIKKIDEEQTNVRVWHYFDTWSDIGPKMQRWANGSTSCD